MEELQEDFKILIDDFISSDNEDTEVLAKSLYKQAEKAFSIQRVSNRFDSKYTPPPLELEENKARRFWMRMV